jgi:hypothetical protein
MPVLALLGDEQIALFEREALAEFGGYDEGAAFAEFGCVHCLNL